MSISTTVRRRVISTSAGVFALVFLTTGPVVSGQTARDPKGPQLLNFNVSPPVREMPPQAVAARAPKEAPFHRTPLRKRGTAVADPVVQTSAATPTAAQVVGQWEGVGAGYPGFSVTAVPPDTNIAVGPQHIVEWVNNAFVVFDKQGVQVQAPVADSTFWGLSTCYQFGGYSDPIVQYDKVADRWIVGEVAIPLLPPLVGQFAQCFAVSTTSDPTGSYYMWAYGFGTNVNDYPKIGVWPDAYYITWNIFAGGGSTFTGPEACAWDRNGMLNGVAAPAFVCFTLSTSYDSLLPSDWDGATTPPSGAPNVLVNVDTASGTLNVWRFHADFVTKANSTLIGPASIGGVAPFTTPCPDACVPQPGTSEQLDTLSDRLMYRLAYRNFGDHESWVVNHTVLGGAGNAAVRWYEIRNPNGTPAVYQQGTFAPDAEHRWMGSVAMDRTGNIGVGYSVSSTGTYPSIRYTGWEVGNPLGALQAETVAVAGGGSQNGYERWGDYSAMRIDPSDDCTFWYAQEYQATTTATSNWSTRIISFRFPSCGRTLTSTTTTLASTPNPSSSGQSVTLTATVSPSTASGSVEFFDGSTSLGTAPLSGGTASMLASALSVGSHSISATYSGDSNCKSSTSAVVTQTVNSNPIGTTTALAASPNPSTYGQSVLLTATVTPASGTGTPAGTVTFLDGATALGSSTIAGGAATLSVSNLSVGAHSIKAQYNGSSTYSGSASAVVTQTINKASTTTTLTSNRNPSNVGQSVTFTATVSASAASGSVQFLDGATILGTVTLSAGRASLSTASLSAGSHSITAKYIGDARYNGSTSAVVTQTVKKSRK